MTSIGLKTATISVASVVAMSGAALAQDTYVSLSGGASLLQDSVNEGVFVGPFTTGAGTTIPAGTVLPDGTEVGWTTDFDTGFAIAGAVGRDFGPFRGEVEVAWQKNGIETHVDVVAGGIALGGQDAGVLVTGSPNLGVSVANLVDDGTGDVGTLFVFANAFYDFDTGGPLKPFIGGGVGVGFVNVDYSPSDVTIIDDKSTEFAWQAMAGIAWEISPTTELFAGYRYRATSDASVEADLFSADFDIENKASIVELGVRFVF
jgi:opacity protein-like surface antigen